MDKREFLLQLAVGVQDLFSDKINGIKDKAHKLEQTLHKLDNTVRNIDGFQRLINQVKQFSLEENRLIIEIEKLQFQKQELNEELIKLQKEYSKTGQSSEHLVDRIKTLKEEIEKMDRVIEENKSKLNIVQQEKNELIRQAEKVKTELSREGVEIENLREAYQKLTQEIKKTQSEYDQLQKKISTSSLEAVGEKLKSIATFGGIGVSSSMILKETFMRAQDIDRQAKLVIARTELKIEDIDKVKKDFMEIYRITGEMPEKISEIYTSFKQQSKLTTEQIKEATIDAIKLQKIYPEVDTKEAVRAIVQMNKQWGISTKEATDLIATAYEKAGDQAGDLLETIWQHGPLMKEAGYSAKEFIAILVSGAKEGAFKYELLADTVKESFKARLVDMNIWQSLVGSADKQGVIDELLPEDKYKNKARRIKNLLAQIREGFITGNEKDKKEGYANLLIELSEIYQKDARLAKGIMEQILGNKGSEDISSQVLKAIGEASLNPEKILGDYKNATDRALSEASTFFSKLNKAFREIEVTFIKVADNFGKTFSPLGDIILEITSGISKFAQAHPFITQLIFGLISVVAVLGTVGVALQTIALISTFAAGGLGLLFSPVTIIVAAITGLIAAALILYKNWDKIWNWIGKKVEVAKNFVVSAINKLKSVLSKAITIYFDFSPLGVFLRVVKSVVNQIHSINLKEAGKKNNPITYRWTSYPYK